MEDKEKLPTTCGECKFYEAVLEFLGDCKHDGNRYDRAQLEFSRPYSCPLVKGDKQP